MPLPGFELGSPRPQSKLINHKSFNSRLNINFGVVQDWHKSIFRNEDSDPYPKSNGAQNKAR